MLHISNVATTAAGETSIRATRPRDTQTSPRGQYDFGDGDLMGGTSCLTIQPMPVARHVKVTSAAVMPDSLPGGALPQDTVVMPTGQMHGLGMALMPVPHAFRHGVAPAHRTKLVGDREVRRVAGSLVPMAPHAMDVERDPITHDRKPVLNRSGTTMARAATTMSPDDRLRQRIAPIAHPANMISRPAALTVVRQNARMKALRAPTPAHSVQTQPTRMAPIRASQPVYTAMPRAETVAPMRDDHPAGCTCPLHGLGADTSAQDAVQQGAQIIGTAIGEGVVIVGVGLLALAGGVYWLTHRKES